MAKRKLPRSNTASTTGGLHPYQKPEFWLKEENQYWKGNDNYTESGKLMLNEYIVNKKKNDERRIKHGKALNSKHL